MDFFRETARLPQRPAMTATIVPTHPFYRWLEKQLRLRDFSHDLAHAARVRDVALRAPLPETPSLPSDKVGVILELAALTHDLADSKYMCSEEQSACRLDLQAALAELTDLSAEHRDAVLLLGQNVSFRRECLGTLPIAALQEKGLLRLHQRLSDADKLDALGSVGLQRLWSFHFATADVTPRSRAEALRVMQGLHGRFVEPRAASVVEFRREALDLLEQARLMLEDVDVA